MKFPAILLYLLREERLWDSKCLSLRQSCSLFSVFKLYRSSFEIIILAVCMRKLFKQAEHRQLLTLLKQHRPRREGTNSCVAVTEDRAAFGLGDFKHMPELFLPSCSTLHFSLLNFMRFFSAHFSSLSRSFWMAVYFWVSNSL